MELQSVWQRILPVVHFFGQRLDVAKELRIAAI